MSYNKYDKIEFEFKGVCLYMCISDIADYFELDLDGDDKEALNATESYFVNLAKKIMFEKNKLHENIITDKEKLLELFCNRLGLLRKDILIGKDIVINTCLDNANVSGYMNFEFTFYFDEDDNLVSVDIFERSDDARCVVFIG